MVKYDEVKVLEPKETIVEDLHIAQVLKILLGIDEEEVVQTKSSTMRGAKSGASTDKGEPDIVTKARELKAKLDLLWEEKGGKDEQTVLDR